MHFGKIFVSVDTCLAISLAAVVKVNLGREEHFLEMQRGGVMCPIQCQPQNNLRGCKF